MTEDEINKAFEREPKDLHELMQRLVQRDMEERLLPCPPQS